MIYSEQHQKQKETEQIFKKTNSVSTLNDFFNLSYKLRLNSFAETLHFQYSFLLVYKIRVYVKWKGKEEKKIIEQNKRLKKKKYKYVKEKKH